MFSDTNGQKGKKNENNSKKVYIQKQRYFSKYRGVLQNTIKKKHFYNNKSKKQIERKNMRAGKKEKYTKNMRRTQKINNFRTDVEIVFFFLQFFCIYFFKNIINQMINYLY